MSSRVPAGEEEIERSSEKERLELNSRKLVGGAMGEKQQHVVAVPLPAQGHLNPLMRFCCKLLRQCKPDSLIVTFVDFDLTHYRLQELHHRHSGAAAATDEADALHDHVPSQPRAVLQSDQQRQTLLRRVHIPIPGLDLSKGFNVSFSGFFDFLLSIGPHLEQLILSLDPPVTCLLSDFNMTFPTQDIADKLGIPRIVLYPCCASRLLFTHYLSQAELISVERVTQALATTGQTRNVFCKLPGLPRLFNSDIPHFRHVTDDTASLWMTTIKSWQVCNTRARAIVVNSFEDLEASTFSTLSKICEVPIYDVGFWVEPLVKENATSLWKEDTSCISWLNQQPTSSVLYISFGSITLLSQTQYQEFLNGLLSSHQRFLWVFRAGLVKNIDYASSVANIMSKCEGRGLVINWAPQLQVLAHSSVGGFLTHCGWNSTTEAIASGVPMICWPYFADQPLNARCIVDEWKVGLMLDRSEDTSLIGGDEIEKVIKSLIQGPEGRVVRENIAKLKEKNHNCFLENGSSSMKLKTLMESLCF